ncbi:MAG TPA: TonB-dependent receptor [Terracidiphilus sp.]|nr:TonB-dependent receptor [Terracidiphilus sp.]
MPFLRGAKLFTLPLLLGAFAALPIQAAQGGNAGSIHGTVTDPSGAVIPNANVTLINQLSGFSRAATTDATGQFSLTNIPFNPYRISVSASGFASASENLEIRSTVETNLNLVLQVAGASQTVTVESAGPQVEDTSTYHTDVDRDMFSKVPLESQSSGLSALVTQTVPGVSADSNGLFHGLGDHASNSFSVDGQSITDQQSKVFSNQIPSNSIQSIEVISGAPPAEYGDKTSLVIVATTRSGQGVTKPTGSVSASYGSFGSATGSFDLSYGGKSWGNFIEADGLNTGRFLDAPEFAVMHDRGNEENFFDRIDYSFTQADSMHLDLNYSRSWFQNPNAFDNLNVQNIVSGGTSANPVFGVAGDTDQRSKIGTFNIAPTYTRVISTNAVLNVGAFARKDIYNYFPSNNPLADLGPANLQTSSIKQIRSLLNTGIHSDFSYDKGINNIKIGAQYSQTFLRESDALGLVDAYLNAPCANANGPVAGYSNPANCAPRGLSANPNYLPVLAPYDLTRGGVYYAYLGRTDVKELALFAEDEIKTGNWDFNLGLREDVYNGLTDANQTEPRLGVAYNIKPTGTVLGISYARTLETPFNENLVLSSQGCGNGVLAPLLNCTSGVSTTMAPGYRNEFHASLQQGFGKNLVLSGEYIWKYTHNAFDFSVLGNTPITFPIDWHNSKIPGFALHVEVPNFHNFSAYTVMSSVAARFFPPQVAGAGATVAQGINYPFRIDHDERFNQNAHVQYTYMRGKWMNGVWGGFNWRYDSGQVAGSVPCYNPLSNDPNSACDPTSTTIGGQPAVDLSGLTADEEFQAGLECNGQAATPTTALPSACLASQYTSKLVKIPAAGTGNNDRNPGRIAPRNLFDASVGKNNLFHADHYKLDLDLTAINVTNKYALYNFLSTFSGTHYVTPRTMTAKLTLNF